jgi:hypothetical protein
MDQLSETGALLIGIVAVIFGMFLIWCNDHPDKKPDSTPKKDAA